MQLGAQVLAQPLRQLRTGKGAGQAEEAGNRKSMLQDYVTASQEMQRKDKGAAANTSRRPTCAPGRLRSGSVIDALMLSPLYLRQYSSGGTHGAYHSSSGPEAGGGAADHAAQRRSNGGARAETPQHPAPLAPHRV